MESAQIASSPPTSPPSSRKWVEKRATLELQGGSRKSYVELVKEREPQQRKKEEQLEQKEKELERQLSVRSVYLLCPFGLCLFCF